jgi:hypothetical protein
MDKIPLGHLLLITDIDMGSAIEMERHMMWPSAVGLALVLNWPASIRLITVESCADGQLQEWLMRIDPGDRERF